MFLAPVLLPAEDEMEEIFATAIVGLRYIVQGLRIMLLLRAGRASQRRTNFDAAELSFQQYNNMALMKKIFRIKWTC